MTIYVYFRNTINTQTQNVSTWCSNVNGFKAEALLQTMSYELTGTVKVIFDEQTFASGFNKREFVVTTEADKFPQDVKFECLKEKVELVDKLNKGDKVKVAFDINGREASAVSANGRVIGTYVHGVFGADGFRRAFLNAIRAGTAGEVNYEATVERTLDAFADHLSESVDVERVLELARR